MTIGYLKYKRLYFMKSQQIPIKNSARGPGFTLIELLVVIAILMILISLITPGIRSAQDRAQSAACLSNLRQIGQTALQFASEWEGALPPVRISASTPAAQNPSHRYQNHFARGTFQGNLFFMAVLQHYMEGTPTQEWGQWQRAPFDRVFLCPATQNTPQRNLQNNLINPSYTVNQNAWASNSEGSVDNPNHWRHQHLPLFRIHRPAEAILLAEGDVGFNNQGILGAPRRYNDIRYSTEPHLFGNSQIDYGEVKWQNTQNLILRHRNQTAFNALYFDGSTRTHVFPNFPYGLVAEWFRNVPPPTSP